MIKVCGMREAENIRDVEALGIDLMGFIFYPKSPRYVSQRPSYMPTKCRRVGVFVNESQEEIMSRVKEFELDVVQLHGGESVELCRALRRSGVEVIKAISVAEAEDLEVANRYVGECDMLLFDTKCKGHGGSGEQFDWSLLSAYCGETPFMLSGGIDVDSAASLTQFFHPRLAGYDINSRFEVEPALKDIALIDRFIDKME